MKLRLALIVILFPVYFIANAQQIQFGVTAALNLSYINGEAMQPKNQPGFEAGGFAIIAVSKNLSIQPELLYNYITASRSDYFTSTYNTSNVYPDSKKTFKLGYLSIPVLLNYKVSDKLTINAGPQYNLLVYSDENLFYHGGAFKNNDFGIRAGLKFAASSTVSLFTSYYTGIATINADNPGDHDIKWQNRQFQLGLDVKLFPDK